MSPLVGGIDEAGRGPLAGPVTAAVVILEQDDFPDGILNDSKRMTPLQRQREFRGPLTAITC